MPNDNTTFVESGRYSQFDDLLGALFDLPPTPYIPIHPDDFYPSEGVEIGMNRAGITSADSKTPIIGTFGLATCMGLAVFNEERGTGGLAHLASSGKLLSPDGKKTLTKLLSEIRRDSTSVIEVRMMGPDNFSIKGDVTKDSFIAGVKRYVFVGSVLKMLDEIPNLRIRSADFRGKPYCRAIGVDTRRWKEGLLKGAPSYRIELDAWEHLPEEKKQLHREGLRHIVDIESLPAASQYRGGIFDARAQKSPNPRSLPKDAKPS